MSKILYEDSSPWSTKIDVDSVSIQFSLDFKGGELRRASKNSGPALEGWHFRGATRT
jgi:hypothetical protein